jgi:alpha-tubulin suppressor-like RCC1 family protein
MGGTIVCWGLGTSGQLGQGAAATSNIPVTVNIIDNARWITAGSAHSCALRATGAVFCWGRNGSYQIGDGILTVANRLVPTQVSGVSDGAQVHAGADSTCVRRANGQIGCFGGNASGNLGDGSLTPRPTFNPTLQIFGLP